MMKTKKLALLPLIALRLTGCDLSGNNIPVSAEKGDKGDTGPQGPKGDKGDSGIDGKDGESLLTGKGTPSSSLGKDGDSYVDTQTWDYYTKEDGKWTKAGNFKGSKGDKGDTGLQGPKGDKGDTGSQGPKGDTGAKGDKGDTGLQGETGPKGDKGDKGDTGISGKDGESLLTGEGVPSSSLGKDGDSYVDTETWDYYTKADGKWTKAGNFKGNKGDKGDAGLQGPKGDKGDDAVTYVPCIFKNYDGTTLYEFYYERGSDIVYDGPTPVKKEKNEEGKLVNWTFVGWDKSLKNIQKPTIFTAQFEYLHYQCTFKNYDGTTLYQTDVDWGEDASYVGDTPTKPDTVDGETTIHWTFTGWDKELTGIKADTIFTAQFDSPNAIKCTFVNYDGTLLGYAYCGKGGKAVYEGQTPTKVSAELDGVITNYRFSGWNKQLTNIQEATTFTANFETYTAYVCKFVNYDGTLLWSTAVAQNGTATYKGDIPVRPMKVNGTTEDGTTNVISYKFKEWDKELYGIKAPTTFTAQYNSTSYSGYKTVFKNKDGSEICYTYTKKGETAVCDYEYLKELISSSYSYDSDNVTMFAGWKEPTSDIRSDSIFTPNIVTIPRKQNGEYPKTQVTDGSLISKLNSITQTDAQGYVSYRGERYQKPQIGPDWLPSIWRKVEPIQWHYLSQNGKNVQFVSEKVLDYREWGGPDHGDVAYANNYKLSYIRYWLNSDFLQQAFYYDSSLIQTVMVDNSPESTGNSSNQYACEDTQDKVYLLSYKDITNEAYGFTDDASRVENDAQAYWLRSPEFDSDSYARYVSYEGNVNCSSISNYYGVRPALTRKLE